MKYGVPPEPGECIDVGSLDVPATLENSGMFAARENLMDVYGSRIPDTRRVWIAIRIMEAKKTPRPYELQLKGLGTLRVGDDEYGGDNWELER